jgi:hypothetical protein
VKMQLFSSSLPQWLVASRVRGISCTENLGTYGGSFPPMSKARRLIMRSNLHVQGEGPGAPRICWIQVSDKQAFRQSQGARLSTAIKHILLTSRVQQQCTSGLHLYVPITGPSSARPDQMSKRDAPRASQEACGDFDSGL